MTKDFFDLFRLSSVFMIIMFAMFMILFITAMVFIIANISARRKAVADAPTLSVPAKVVAKRTAVWGEHAHTSYYATFEFQSGDRAELSMHGTDYGMLAEGDYGTLTYKGPQFISFVR